MNRRKPLRASPLLACQGLFHRFQEGGAVREVLKNIDFALQPGERVAIVGPSGSGKSTLLHLLGGLTTPTEGRIQVAGQTWAQLSEEKRSHCRRQYLGFVYQFHHLLPEFTVLENICMPLLIGGAGPKQAAKRAWPLIEQAGLGARRHAKPAEISGGERQRTAIVRALVTAPHCVLADEPTGNLDARTAEQVFEMFLALNQAGLVMVTHDRQLAARMDRVLHLEDAQLWTV